MDSTVWGPTAWYLLHILSYSYDDKHKNDYINIVNNYAKVLPCSVCKGHFKKMLSKTPAKKHAISGPTMSKWMVDVHNTVNKRLGKRVYTQKAAKDLYHKHGNLVFRRHKVIKWIDILNSTLANYKNRARMRGTLGILESLAKVIPCDKCKKNLAGYIANNPIKNVNLRSANKWIAGYNRTLKNS